MKTVSLIVPCRNESDHITAFCAAVSLQRLPADWRLELAIADGRSDDGTRERLAAISSADAR
ncbi:MAG: glycosyl transferase family 2, partial [Rhizobacter sp.]|nr:glycosyl transferase family 2 [Rhizobacter sp.]